MNLKCSINGLRYMPSSKIGGGAASNCCIPKTSFSIPKLCEFFKMYEDCRKVKHPIFAMIDDCVSAIFRNCRLRIFEDDNGKMLAGYTYKIRKNGLEEKSIYIDGLARNLSDKKSKNMMISVYEDIKNTAKKRKAKELTLFVFSGERNLRKNYERLGFKLDPKCDIKKVYLMRVRVENFLNNTYFMLRKYKEALGLDSILRTKN